MPAFLRSLTANPATSTFTTINTNDPPGVIRSATINNGTAEFIVMRLKSDTNVSVQFGTGTFQLPRVNLGDLELRAAGTNSASVLVFAGNPEDPA